MDTIGKRLKWARKRKGWTQGRLADALNYSRTYMTALETGRNELHSNKLVQAAQLLGVPVEFLASGDNAPDGTVPLSEITIPAGLAEMAQEYDGFSFAQILSLLEIWRITRGPMDKAAWVKLWETVRGMT